MKTYFYILIFIFNSTLVYTQKQFPHEVIKNKPYNYSSKQVITYKKNKIIDTSYSYPVYNEKGLLDTLFKKSRYSKKRGKNFEVFNYNSKGSLLNQSLYFDTLVIPIYSAKYDSNNRVVEVKEFLSNNVFMPKYRIVKRKYINDTSSIRYLLDEDGHVSIYNKIKYNQNGYILSDSIHYNHIIDTSLDVINYSYKNRFLQTSVKIGQYRPLVNDSIVYKVFKKNDIIDSLLISNRKILVKRDMVKGYEALFKYISVRLKHNFL